MSFGIGSDATTVRGLHSFAKMLICNKHLQSDGSHKTFKILIVDMFLDFKSA